MWADPVCSVTAGCITLVEVFVDINTPLHPGEERYYREIGLEIPEEALTDRDF